MNVSEVSSGPTYGRGALESHEDIDGIPNLPPFPTDETLIRLCRIWEAAFCIPTVEPDDDFEALGGDSVTALEILAEVQRVFGTKLSPTVFAGGLSCGRLAERVRAGAGPEPSRLAVLRTGAGRPLFFVPGGGGSAFRFERLLRAADLGRPAFAVQLPVVMPGAELPDTLPELAAEYVRQMCEAQPEGPFDLIGYSFGGRLAFEMACQLVASGRPVAFLGLFDAYGPRYPRRRRLPSRVVEHLAILARLDNGARGTYLRDLRNRWVDRLRGRRAQAQAAALCPDPREVPAYIRADYSYCRRLSIHYEHGVYPGRLTLFRASIEPYHFGIDFGDPRLGWRGFAAQGIRVVRVPGDHHTMLEEPNVSALARALREGLGAG
jgi:thioesterase domain-containing protein/acyl carrier protein